MKNILLLLFVLITSSLSAQTQMTNKKNLGSLAVWDVVSVGEVVGHAYSVETGTLDLLFSPNRTDLSRYKLVCTGTYTSPDGRVAGSAFDAHGHDVGNEGDKLFRPNAYLAFDGGDVMISHQAEVKAISVYQVLDDSIIWSVVNARTKKAFQWRFLVVKEWQRNYGDATSERGRDVMIIDLDKSMSLSDACRLVYDLRRCRQYYQASDDQFFDYCSTMRAVLLDVGAYRPMLVNGEEVHGPFPSQQSNVIVIR